MFSVRSSRIIELKGMISSLAEEKAYRSHCQNRTEWFDRSYMRGD